MVFLLRDENDESGCQWVVCRHQLDLPTLAVSKQGQQRLCRISKESAKNHSVLRNKSTMYLFASKCCRKTEWAALLVLVFAVWKHNLLWTDECNFDEKKRWNNERIYACSLFVRARIKSCAVCCEVAVKVTAYRYVYFSELSDCRFLCLSVPLLSDSSFVRVPEHIMSKKEPAQQFVSLLFSGQSIFSSLINFSRFIRFSCLQIIE